MPGAFDIPTEAQWEYACRAGTTSAHYNGGNTEADLASLARYNTTSHVAVGSYAPNGWGLYDLYGNAWEVCIDWFAENNRNRKDSSIDPVGPARPSSSPQYVARGGTYKNTYHYCRSAFRGGQDVNITNDSIGFRLSMTLP